MRPALSALLAASVAALASVAFGCGGGQTRGTAFDPRWANDNGVAAAALQRSIASTPVPLGADVAVGVVGKDTLVGGSLDGGTTWTFKHALDTRPQIAGQTVVAVGGGEVFALDAKTGKLLWKRGSFGLLRGVGDDGQTTIVSFLSAAGRGSTVLAVRRDDGSVLRQIEDDAPIGVPAVLGSYAFLPWQGQYVSVYDVPNGEEKARLLLRTTTSRAFATGGAIFFGEVGLTRFDDKIGGASSNAASTVSLPMRELPGSPKWMSPGTDTVALAALAPDRVRLYARPTTKGEAGIDGGRFAATYYRVAVGFEAKQGGLAWAYTHGSDFIGGAAYEGGFALCDEDGKVTMLDGRTGQIAGSIDLGKKLEACVVQADGFKKAASGAATPLAEQLGKAVTAPNAELVTVQKLLLREMAALPDESVTKTLIDLAASDRTPPELVQPTRSALAARRTGQNAMLDALKRHYDFLEGVLRPPPVGPLADALAAMKEKRAAPLLALHINDPATPPDDVQRAAAALIVLASPSELQDVSTFFAHYRGADGIDSDEPLQNAVVSCAQTLVKIGGNEVVAGALRDSFTSPAVKSRIEGLLKK